MSYLLIYSASDHKLVHICLTLYHGFELIYLACNCFYSFRFCVLQYDIPASATALQSVMDASLDSLHQRWEVGWSLASFTNGSASFRDALQKQVLSLLSFSYEPKQTSLEERNEPNS